MDRLEKFRHIIQDVLIEYANIGHSYGDIKSQIVFDNKADHYLLIRHYSKFHFLSYRY